jgi:hypothetical protein
MFDQPISQNLKAVKFSGFANLLDERIPCPGSGIIDPISLTVMVSLDADTLKCALLERLICQTSPNLACTQAYESQVTPSTLGS